MKIRKGFVSNSSSSSFVVAFKGDNLKKELENIFKVENLLLKGIGKAVADCFVENAEKVVSLKDYVEEQYGDSNIEYWIKEDSTLKKMKKLIDDGWMVWTGSFGTDAENPLEYWLCETDLNYKGENIVIIHEGGF
jgi:hypothetical protein